MHKRNIKYWLEEFHCFYLKGNDSRRFLNGITTSNLVKNKNPIIKTCWLNTQGNLRSLLEIHVENKNSNHFLIVVLQGNINELIKYCKSMIFLNDDIQVGEIFTVFRLQEINDCISWRNHIPKLLIGINQKDFCEKNGLTILDNNALNIWKINQAIPSLDREINGNNNPIELGLSDLIDFDKGCYLGQEKIARIRNLASLRHEIRVWKTKQPIDKLFLNNNKIYLNRDKEEIVGYVTTFQENKSKNVFGMAMIKKNFLNIYEYFFSEQLGEIYIQKSSSSVFL